MKIQMDGFHKIYDDLEKVIDKEDTNSSITSDSDDAKTDLKTCREKVEYVLNTSKFQIVIVCLVILDCLFVIAELLIDMEIITLPNHHANVAPMVFHYCSLAVLSLFIIEIIIRICALRLKFFKHKLEMFDAIIVIVSFVLDIVFRKNEGPESGLGLLVVLRLWRVTRILNGIVLTVKKQAEKKLQRERRLRQACEQELTKYREYCTAQEQEIELLRGLLRKHGIEDITRIDRQPIVVRTIDVVAEVNHLASEKTSSTDSGSERNSSPPASS
ncbi:HV1 [Mytilus edulis]|uniref:Voltage-gated hydrogen channel 1 n=1 Tax=Mytilus edulis TaxID=6550 RepID=A0A8S3TPU6_MYTED|nr:HV1 [Mytilus edulis]